MNIKIISSCKYTFISATSYAPWILCSSLSFSSAIFLGRVLSWGYWLRSLVQKSASNNLLRLYWKTNWGMFPLLQAARETSILQFWNCIFSVSVAFVLLKEMATKTEKTNWALKETLCVFSLDQPGQQRLQGAFSSCKPVVLCKTREQVITGFLCFCSAKTAHLTSCIHRCTCASRDVVSLQLPPLYFFIW